MRRLGLLIATCAHVGHLPLAPGTFGSLAGLGVYALVRWSGLPLVELGTIVVILAMGVWSGGVAERHYQRTDPAPVVIDEVAGMLITLAFVPVNLAGAVVAFLLFRLLDVVKPWPADRLERLHGGVGVMADDAMAAVYGNLLLRLLVFVAPAGWLT